MWHISREKPKPRQSKQELLQILINGKEVKNKSRNSLGFKTGWIKITSTVGGSETVHT